MAKAIINPGICNFTTVVIATTTNNNTVHIEINTSCPNIKKAAHQLKEVEPLTEIFSKFHETAVYKTLSEVVPHVTCPVYSGILKTIEVEAGLALPKDVSITIEK